MISQLKGIITHKELLYVILDVSGVGYKVHVSPETSEGLSVGEDAHLWTHLAVRENALDLYGFIEKEGVDFFEMLISISGIGPKSAMSILSITSVQNLASAISSGDTAYLTKVSGIGKKNANKIVLELQDKLGVSDSVGSHQIKEESEAIEALKTLGYSTKEARDALKRVDPDLTTTQEKIKSALKNLGT
jgi:holliday junction DNA helicase RuvA